MAVGQVPLSDPSLISANPPVKNQDLIVNEENVNPTSNNILNNADINKPVELAKGSSIIQMENMNDPDFYSKFIMPVLPSSTVQPI